MKPRVVLLTRSWRPSGALMAWKLLKASGVSLEAVIVESRGRMVKASSKPLWSRLCGLGWDFIRAKGLETLRIHGHYLLRRILGRRFRGAGYFSIEELALDFPALRVIRVEDHNTEEVRDLLKEMSPDIGVLTNTRRIEPRILEVPKHGFLNLHLSELPKYAGLDSIFWALYHGEEKIGATVHRVVREIDKGDIVLQGSVRVAAFDDEQSLYEKALWLGTSLMIRALEDWGREGRISSHPQKTAQGSYFSWPSAAERLRLKRRWKSAFGASSLRASSELPRICHVITRLIRGGAQLNTLATVKGLAREGYPVVLITGPTWSDEGELLTEALEEGLEVKISRDLVREVSPLKDFSAVLKLASFLRRHPCDILHTHTSKAGLLGRLAAAALWGGARPLVVHTPHGHVFHSYFSPWKEQSFLWIERFAALLTDKLVALTAICRDEHLKLGVGLASQWTVIPSGIDEKSFLARALRVSPAQVFEQLGIPESSTVIGFVGRLAPVKGPQVLVEALGILKSSGVDFHALFVGDGELRARLQTRAQELGVMDSLRITGYLKDVAPYLSAVNMLVVPSLNEGMGRVIAEAGILAKPVIASRIGGIPDLIEDGKSGILVPAGDAPALAGAIRSILASGSRAAQMGEALKTGILSAFTQDQMVAMIKNLYAGLMLGRGWARWSDQPQRELVH